MKKALFTTAMIMMIVLLSRCKKVYEYIEANPGADIKTCPILKISYSGLFSGTDTITFTYNSNGDPVSGKRREPRTGAPNYIFQYDKKGRLTDFAGVYGSVTGELWGAEYWHKYFYDGTGKIALDSIWSFCLVQNGKPVRHPLSGPGSVGSVIYTYDSKGRIIKDSATSGDGYIMVNTYSYNANGNRTGRGYDQKVNFLRTNRIWMFLAKDYSLNNPFTALIYNSTGLPTKLSIPVKSAQVVSFLSTTFNEAEITYGCK